MKNTTTMEQPVNSKGKNKYEEHNYNGTTGER